MKETLKKKYIKIPHIIISLVMVTALLSPIFLWLLPVNAQQENTQSAAGKSIKVENGSFEEPVIGNKQYDQLSQEKVPYWQTTAYNTNGSDGMIELFKSNTVYIPNRQQLDPTDGKQAAELNADEESTLYQNINTIPGSIYMWGLDHRGRTGVDTMALVIGPKQDVDPSKNKGNGYDKSNNYHVNEYKYGSDQMMQMVDWAKAQGLISIRNTQEVEKITLYSKKFGDEGTFLNNEDNIPFSLSYSSVYSEMWTIWVLASDNDKWYSYGSNDKSAQSLVNDYGNVYASDINASCFYRVPSGQTETIFGFVSVDSAKQNDTTFGNLLDNINFEIFSNMSGSSTDHGSASMSNSGVIDLSQTSDDITKNNPINVYTSYGCTQNLISKISAEDAERVSFAGIYITKQLFDETGTATVHTDFLARDGNEIEQSLALEVTDWEKQSVSGVNKTTVYKSASSEWVKQVDKQGNTTYAYPGKWVKQTDSEGNIAYTYQLADITYAFDVHFIFLKCPTITYDSNGGKPYELSSENTSSCYDFKPIDSGGMITYIGPYQSHEPEGQNDGWKFTGWSVNDDFGVVTDANGNELILDGVHSIACNYRNKTGTDATQQFIVINEGNDFTTTGPIHTESGELIGQDWSTSRTSVYSKEASGLTMVARWLWRQRFIPQTKHGDSYIESDAGGTVEITNIDGVPYGNGGEEYYAETDQMIRIEATPKEGYIFDGWYDDEDKLITMNAKYNYTEEKGSVKTYYAKFTPSNTQRFIRQVGSDGNWSDISDDEIGTLSSYEDHGTIGQQAVSKPTANNKYKFVGWYDKSGNKVPDSMVNGDALVYTITEDATYYARFQLSYQVYFVAQTEQSDDSYIDSTVGGVTDPTSAKYLEGESVSSTAQAFAYYDFIGWYDSAGNKLPNGSQKTYTPSVSAQTDGTTYYARFKRHLYTVNFVTYTKYSDGTFKKDTVGGTANPTSIQGVKGSRVSGTVTANKGYKFVGWYSSESAMKNNGSTLGTNDTLNVTIGGGNSTYLALFVEDSELKVSKNVTGNMADHSKEFEVIVDITDGDNAVATLYKEDGTQITDRSIDITTDGNTKRYTTSLQDGDYILIQHLSGKAQYVVTEADYSSDGYVTAFTKYDEDDNLIDNETGNSGSMVNNRYIVITNENEMSSPPAGIHMDTSFLWIPFLIVLLLSLVFCRKKGWLGAANGKSK